MKAIIHIGTEKTGTTSIQNYLYLNRKKLKSAGYHFVQSAGKTNNRAIPAYCINDERYDDFFREEGIKTPAAKHDFKQKFIRDFENEIRSAPESIHTFVISSEHFHSRIRTNKEMDNVYNFLSAYFDEIKIVCYLREQVGTCTSYYSTHLKNNGTESLRKFLQRCNPGNYYYNYHQMLANWERCFGFEALDVSLFAQERFLNGDLLDDFTAKIDRALVGTLNKSVEADNESLRPFGQVLARAVNFTFPINSERFEVSNLRAMCKKIIAKGLTGKGQQPALEARKLIYDTFVESNELVRQKFFPTVKTLFEQPSEEVPPDNLLARSDFEILAQVVNALSKHGVGLIAPEEYTQLCTTLFSCINDVYGIVSDSNGIGTEPILNENDAHILRLAAKRLESENIEAAIRLMSLAVELRPNWHAIKLMLDEYRQRDMQVKKSRYMIAYHGASKPKTAEEREIYTRFEAWLASLNVPFGSRLIGIVSARTVIPDSSVVADDHTPMGGYSIIEAESMDAVLSIVNECPIREVGSLIRISELKFLTGGW